MEEIVRERGEAVGVSLWILCRILGWGTGTWFADSVFAG